LAGERLRLDIESIQGVQRTRFVTAIEKNQDKKVVIIDDAMLELLAKNNQQMLKQLLEKREQAILFLAKSDEHVKKFNALLRGRAVAINAAALFGSKKEMDFDSLIGFLKRSKFIIDATDATGVTFIIPKGYTWKVTNLWLLTLIEQILFMVVNNEEDVFTFKLEGQLKAALETKKAA
jgi:hypothetical protein